jgi:hypothetical protein
MLIKGQSPRIGFITLSRETFLTVTAQVGRIVISLSPKRYNAFVLGWASIQSQFRLVDHFALKSLNGPLREEKNQKMNLRNPWIEGVTGVVLPSVDSDSENQSRCKPSSRPTFCAGFGFGSRPSDRERRLFSGSGEWPLR